jgi:hypothetical protein
MGTPRPSPPAPQSPTPPPPPPPPTTIIIATPAPPPPPPPTTIIITTPAPPPPPPATTVVTTPPPTGSSHALRRYIAILLLVVGGLAVAWIAIRERPHRDYDDIVIEYVGNPNGVYRARCIQVNSAPEGRVVEVQPGDSIIDATYEYLPDGLKLDADHDTVVYFDCQDYSVDPSPQGPATTATTVPATTTTQPAVTLPATTSG